MGLLGRILAWLLDRVLTRAYMTVVQTTCIRNPCDTGRASKLFLIDSMSS